MRRCVHILTSSVSPAYNAGMRTTLTIDDDLMAAARSLARARSESLGQAVSELMRRGLCAAPSVSPAGADDVFPTFCVPETAHVLTLEDVQRDGDDL